MVQGMDSISELIHVVVQMSCSMIVFFDTAEFFERLSLNRVQFSIYAPMSKTELLPHPSYMLDILGAIGALRR